MSDRFLTIFFCFCVIILIGCYYSIKDSLNKLDNVETEEELLEIKKEISSSSFILFLSSIIPFILNLVFGFE